MRATAIPCLFMRGGTSKGPFFQAADLPADVATRDRVLLAIVGSPDKRQIDGLGGAHPLTSKVGIVAASTRPGIDLEFLFAQLQPDKDTVDTTPHCGNMLAAVVPFVIETGMVAPRGSTSTFARVDAEHGHGLRHYRCDARRTGRIRRRRAHRRRTGAKPWCPPRCGDPRSTGEREGRRGARRARESRSWSSPAPGPRSGRARSSRGLRPSRTARQSRGRSWRGGPCRSRRGRWRRSSRASREGPPRAPLRRRRRH